MVNDIIQLISKYRFSLTDEKETQQQMENCFKSAPMQFNREHKLDASNIPDFFIDGIIVEVKLKGSRRAIYSQIERYSKFEEVDEIILVTNRSMGLPRMVNNKRCHVLNLGMAWL